MRTQAIILKKIPIKEYDELLICYTKDAGKQVYQAKSILRRTSKQASHLDIFNLVDFSLVEGNGQPIITSAYCLSAFPRMKASLKSLAAGFFVLECFDRLVFEGEHDPKLWDFLLSSLNQYNDMILKRGVDWASMINTTRMDLLNILGYGDNSSIEELAQVQFKSLQFARKVIR
jgi:DNA repair protein RecO